MRFHRRHIEIDGYSAVCDIYGIQLLNTHELKQLCRRGGKAEAVNVCVYQSKKGVPNPGTAG